jgi:hypothetical protein
MNADGAADAALSGAGGEHTADTNEGNCDQNPMFLHS